MAYLSWRRDRGGRLLDGHDVGAKVLIYWLRDQGMEVIYTGLRQSAEQVVGVSLQEAVDIIGAA